MSVVLLDTGPLVALLNRRDAQHAWAREVLDAVAAPLFTCEAVLSEASFLLQRFRGGPDAVLNLVARGVVRCSFRMASDVDALRELMRKFEDVPMSLADACLVRMTELDRQSVVLTLDADFRVYRRNRRQVIPTLMPPDRKR